MQLHQDHVYVAYSGTSYFGGSGLLRINKYGGQLEEVVGDISDTGGNCRGLHIHGMY